MRAFVPARELSAGLYAEVVRPLLGDVAHAAAFLGWGSDVLGFDTERSTDHGWGPRLQVFVEHGDMAAELAAAIDHGLPDTFGGWPVRFDRGDGFERRHWVDVTTLPAWCADRLGFDATAGVTTVDWLLTPQQLLLGVTAGAVFHDGLGALTELRARLAWYPDDVWRWLLACQWHRISQEEAFVGRTAEVGDELGSRIVAARIARDLVRLCFLVERRYAPYSKWLGTAFSRLDAAATIGPVLEQALAAAAYPDREAALVAAYEQVARRSNALHLTEPVDPTVRRYHDRPYLVLHSERFSQALRDSVAEEWLQRLPLIGSVDQHADSTDVLAYPDRVRRLRSLYAEHGAR